ncbi:MAG: HugZ family protein [Acidiferrobacterales bacterium]
MSSNENLDRIAEDARAFMAGFKTLLMATANADGGPLASYAPFVSGLDQSFYIYVSGLSKHTRDLDETGAASVLFIEDERDTNQPFARKRLVLDCRAEPVSRDSEEWHEILENFAETFGDVMDLLKPLADFKLFRLRPTAGMYVRGFGKAYRFTGAVPKDFEHIKV